MRNYAQEDLETLKRNEKKLISSRKGVQEEHFPGQKTLIDTDELIFTDEWVFYTLQGEGAFTGRPTVFVRLSSCNLRCVWKNKDQSISYCDTPYSSFNPERKAKTILETVSKILSYQCSHVVITGGEPYLQRGVALLIDLLVKKGLFVTVETNGTIFLKTNASFLSISPKLNTSCYKESKYYSFHEEKRLNIDVLASLVLGQGDDYQFKFVINSEDDVIEIKEIIDRIESKLGKRLHNIFLMAQAVNSKELKKKEAWVADLCRKNFWSYSDRLHLRLWDGKRAY